MRFIVENTSFGGKRASNSLDEIYAAAINMCLICSASSKSPFKNRRSRKQLFSCVTVQRSKKLRDFKINSAVI